MDKWEKENEDELGAPFNNSTNQRKIHDEQ